jgi:hypothetical protein
MRSVIEADNLAASMCTARVLQVQTLALSLPSVCTRGCCRVCCKLIQSAVACHLPDDDVSRGAVLMVALA